MDDAIERQQAQGLPHGGTYRGLAEVRANSFDLLDRDWWSAFTAVPSEFIDAGDEVVARPLPRTAKHTGKALDVPFVHIWSRARQGVALPAVPRYLRLGRGALRRSLTFSNRLTCHRLAAPLPDARGLPADSRPPGGDKFV